MQIRSNKSVQCKRSPTKIQNDAPSFTSREKVRPAPPSLQAIVDGPSSSVSSNRFTPNRPSRPSRPQIRPEPVEVEPVKQPEPTLPPRLSIQPIQPVQQTERPARIQILTEKPLTTVPVEVPYKNTNLPMY